VNTYFLFFYERYRGDRKRENRGEREGRREKGEGR
jgi:hypothetical protein